MNNPLQNTIILLLEQIVAALGTDFKVYLPHIIPHILRVFLHDTTPGRTTTAKVRNCCSNNDGDDGLTAEVLPESQWPVGRRRSPFL